MAGTTTIRVSREAHSKLVGLSEATGQRATTLIGDIWLVDFGDPYPREPAHRRPALEVGPVPSTCT